MKYIKDTLYDIITVTEYWPVKCRPVERNHSNKTQDDWERPSEDMVQPHPTVYSTGTNVTVTGIMHILSRTITKQLKLPVADNN